MGFQSSIERILGASTRTFGETVTCMPVGGATFLLQGIFTTRHTEIDAQGYQISSNKPKLGVRLSDFPKLPRADDRLVIRNLTYRVVDVQEDGDGGADIIMHVLGARQDSADSTQITADSLSDTADEMIPLRHHADATFVTADNNLENASDHDRYPTD